jgi:hypothetical protein
MAGKAKPGKAKPGKTRFNLTLDDDAAQILRQAAPSMRTMGQYVSQSLRETYLQQLRFACRDPEVHRVELLKHLKATEQECMTEAQYRDLIDFVYKDKAHEKEN